MPQFDITFAAEESTAVAMQYNVTQCLVQVLYFWPGNNHTVLQHVATHTVCNMLPHTQFATCYHTHSLQHVATHTVTVLGGTWHLHYPTENEIRQNPVLKFSSNLTVNTFPVCCNLTASGALRDKTALRLYQGVLYLQNVL